MKRAMKRATMKRATMKRAMKRAMKQATRPVMKPVMRRKVAGAVLVLVLAVGLTARIVVPAAVAGERSPCTVVTGPTAAPTPTTVDVIGQAYRCVYARYADAAALDDRQLLTGAFGGLTRELARRTLDRPEATLPAFTGNRDRDWAAFKALYQRLLRGLPADPALRQALAAATLTGLTGSLHDDHVSWTYPVRPPGAQLGQAYGLGFATAPFVGLAIDAPDEALPPLYVTSVLGGPAAAAGLRPGDVIESVDGAPPFVDGIPVAGAMKRLAQQYPNAQPVTLGLHRPSDQRTWTVTLTPALFPLGPAATDTVTTTVVGGDVAEVRLTGFTPGAADRVITSLTGLPGASGWRGVVLDLRGNGGGDPAEVARLLGAFTHGRTWSFDCDADDHCTPNRTDDAVALLHLPLVVLTDRTCASACDAFCAAVRDLRLGPLVGTRTAGSSSGIAADYLMADNSLLRLPSSHQRAANGETIDGIGVAPDYDIPRTPQDVSTGHDPDLAKALALLRPT
jgi:carboxyl-terminal processing protease